MCLAKQCEASVVLIWQRTNGGLILLVEFAFILRRMVAELAGKFVPMLLH